jgi:disulfide bond formation protein DsbB
MTSKYSIWLNIIGLSAVCFTLLFAFADQIVQGNIPCPLCILQRAGIIAAGFGLVLNLKTGMRPSHYGLIVLGAAISGSVAARHVLLHIVPGTGAYGHAFLDLHFYTWVFIISALMITGAAIMLLFDRQFGEVQPALKMRTAVYLPIALFMVLTVANGVSTLLQCGGGICPADPTGYLLLS